MSKGILEFNLDDSFEKEAFKRASSATDAYLVLWDIQEYLRNKSKYGEADWMPISEIQERIGEFLEKYNVDLDDLS